MLNYPSKIDHMLDVGDFNLPLAHPRPSVAVGYFEVPVLIELSYPGAYLLKVIRVEDRHNDSH